MWLSIWQEYAACGSCLIYCQPTVYTRENILAWIKNIFGKKMHQYQNLYVRLFVKKSVKIIVYLWNDIFQLMCMYISGQVKKTQSLSIMIEVSPHLFFKKIFPPLLVIFGIPVMQQWCISIWERLWWREFKRSGDVFSLLSSWRTIHRLLLFKFSFLTHDFGKINLEHFVMK